jgi:ribonuclease HII
MKQMINLLPFFRKGVVEAGCDEAGRGCLAGPVYAAAVILPSKIKIEGLDDSKKLTAKEREMFKTVIMESAIAWAIGTVSSQEVDKINILNASILAMHRALDQLKKKPKHILVDGNRFRQWGKVPYTCVVKGDGKYLNIAAASVPAKTARDDYMRQIHEEFPMYNWASNKGYATEEHCEALKKFGYSKYHRRTFHLKSFQTRLEF